ncbi:dihydrodipicolinate synthase family protein [Horticoccus sp. 23ND18S-11]|uniref:dihydrodipicolinate synthase family protein n=1 Tax=Horticoccus sp. 23ND18S-11 TaxID=3391832 RepID=UPI0039C8E3F3
MNLSRLQSPDPHVIVALVTPFTAAGDVDTVSLQRHVGHVQRHGVDEFFVVGSTGESPLLDEADRRLIMDTVRAAAPAGVVYAGISGTGHRHAIRNAREAAQAGADVAVLMAPFFLSLNQEQLAAFCVAVADASPIPVAVYHHLRMPTPFAVPTVARLAAHPNIFAIKDTNGGDQNRCAEILAATAGQSFKFFQGVEKLVLPTLEAGGHGCVVAQGNLAPHLFRRVAAAWRAGDLAAAQDAQRRIDALWGIFLRPEVKRSFCHFLHTIKLPLHQRGILATTASALPGVTFEPEFETMITDFMAEHLDVEPTLTRT